MMDGEYSSESTQTVQAVQMQWSVKSATLNLCSASEGARVQLHLTATSGAAQDDHSLLQATSK